MDRLVALHKEHDAQGVPPEVEAAWLHHRFTQIHPFQDGNGRVARVLASLVFLRAGWFPLVVNRDERVTYIDALEKADRGNILELTALLGGMQKQRMLQALSLSETEDAGHGRKTSREQMFAALEEKLASRQDITQSVKMDRVFELAQVLMRKTEGEFGVVSERIKILLHESNGGNSYTLNDFSQSLVWVDVVNRIATEHGYTPNFSVPNPSVALTIHDDNLCRISVHVHGLGRPFTGVLVALAVFSTRSEEINITRVPFQFTYNEIEDDVVVRYKPWLDEVILLGLDEWRKRL